MKIYYHRRSELLSDAFNCSWVIKILPDLCDVTLRSVMYIKIDDIKQISIKIYNIKGQIGYLVSHFHHGNSISITSYAIYWLQIH